MMYWDKIVTEEGGRSGSGLPQVWFTWGGGWAHQLPQLSDEEVGLN